MDSGFPPRLLLPCRSGCICLRGVPQGSILSPYLFNVLLSYLFLPMHLHFLIYADDITIISRTPTLTEAQELFQDAATALTDLVTTWGLIVSVQKSATVCTSPAPPLTTLCGEAIPYTTTHTLLGLQLNGPRPSWTKHLEYLRTSCNRRIDVVRRITGVW